MLKSPTARRGVARLVVWLYRSWMGDGVEVEQ